MAAAPAPAGDGPPQWFNQFQQQVFDRFAALEQRSNNAAQPSAERHDMNHVSPLALNMAYPSPASFFSETRRMKLPDDLHDGPLPSIFGTLSKVPELVQQHRKLCRVQFRDGDIRPAELVGQCLR